MPKSKRGRRSLSQSGYIGVRKKESERFQALIRIDGKQKCIGSYDTDKQAAKAYDKEAIKLRVPFSKLNYPGKAPVGYAPMQQALQSTNTIGYRGVYKSVKNFRSSIYIDGKNIYSSSYDTTKEAAIAYDRAVLKANQSTSLLNFPEMVHNLDVEPKRKKQKVASNNSTGYKGVYKSGEKFTAMATINGKLKYFGSFNTAVAAALAYDQAVIKKGNKKSTLNFPEGEKKQEKQKKQKIKKMKKKQKKQKITKKKELLTIQEYNEMLQASK